MNRVGIKNTDLGPQMYNIKNIIGKKFSKDNKGMGTEIIEEATNVFPVNEVEVINSVTGKKVEPKEVKTLGGNVDILV